MSNGGNGRGNGTGRRAKRLKPAGHSATIEALIQPAIVVASTLMSAIAAYVLAYDAISRLLQGRWTWEDVLVIVLCVGMGFLIDMAIIVSATRYKMHAVRADPREKHWKRLAQWVLIIGLTSETMTLFYFFVHLDPAAYPSGLVWLAGIVHAFLVSARAFLPPVVVAYFAAGVLPISFDRADRNREIKTRTSTNVMALIDQLSVVHDTDDTAEKLRALGGQLVLDTYATYDETGRTTEDEQLRRDGKLLAHMARMHGLDWSRLGVDVAPELVTPTASPLGIHALPTQHLTPPTPQKQAAPPAPLSRHDQRRAALAESMYTDLDEYDLSNADDATDAPADDFGEWGDDGDDSFARRSHPTRPRGVSLSNQVATRSRAQAAHIAPRAAALVVDEPWLDPLTDLPPSKYESENDSDACRRVMRVLDQDNTATRNEVIKRAGVSDQTARRYIDRWNTLRSKRGRKKVARRTQEMPAITDEMLSGAASK